VGQEADHVATLIDHGVTAEQLRAVEAMRATVTERMPELLSSLERAIVRTRWPTGWTSRAWPRAGSSPRRWPRPG